MIQTLRNYSGTIPVLSPGIQYQNSYKTVRSEFPYYVSTISIILSLPKDVADSNVSPID